MVAPEFSNPLPPDVFHKMPTKTLLDRLGFVRYLDSPSGFFDILPLGRLFTDQIVGGLRRFSVLSGFQEVSMSPVQPAALMERSGRMDTFARDVYRLPEHSMKVLLSAAHEEYVIELFRSLGLKRAASLPITVFSFDTVLRRKRNRSAGGLAWTPMIPGYICYSVGASHEQLREQGAEISDALLSLFSDLQIPIIPVLKDEDFVDFVSESEFGRENYYSCDLNHPVELSSATCGECGGAARSKRIFSLAQHFIAGSSYAEQANYRVQLSGSSFFPILSTAGLGLTRMLMLVLDRSRTTDGVRWPNGFAPVEVAVRAESGVDAGRALSTARWLAAGDVRVLLDDRHPWVPRMADSLRQIGVPVTVTIGGNDLVHVAGQDGDTCAAQSSAEVLEVVRRFLDKPRSVGSP